MKLISELRAWWEYRRSNRCYRLWNLTIMPTVPYPARSMSIHLTINPTGCWWKPSFTRRHLTEQAKAEGETVWWARWLFFQISYSRFL